LVGQPPYSSKKHVSLSLYDLTKKVGKLGQGMELVVGHGFLHALYWALDWGWRDDFKGSKLFQQKLEN
jgi:hypothetical protein